MKTITKENEIKTQEILDKSKDSVAKGDKLSAIKLWKEACKLGNLTACYNLGQAYRDGWGVKQSYRLAFKYYEYASNHGHPPAKYNLGVMYEQGIGVEKNFIEAYELFSASAYLGYAPAKKAMKQLYGEKVK